MAVMSILWLDVVECCRKEAGWPGQKNRVQNFCHGVSHCRFATEAIRAPPEKRARKGSGPGSDQSGNHGMSPSILAPAAQGIWKFCIAFFYSVFIKSPTA
jgi:hypothetical protein